MNDATTVALTQAGFALDGTGEMWIRVDSGERTGIRFDLPGRVAIYTPDENLPTILHALTTTAPYSLTDEERARLVGLLKQRNDAQWFTEREAAEDQLIALLCDEGILYGLLARSESAPPSPALAIAQRWLASIENPSLAPLEIHAADVQEVVRVLSQSAPPEPTSFTNAQLWSIGAAVYGAAEWHRILPGLNVGAIVGSVVKSLRRGGAS